MYELQEGGKEALKTQRYKWKKDIGRWVLYQITTGPSLLSLLQYLKKVQRLQAIRSKSQSNPNPYNVAESPQYSLL